MTAPEIVRARRQQPAPVKCLGQVVNLEAGFRVRVTVRSGTTTAHVPAAHRSVQKDDVVEVTWPDGGGGDPRVTDVMTRRTPPAFSASGANTSSYSANTAPPAAVSGTSSSVTATIGTTSFPTTGTISYDGGSFTPAHVAALNTFFGRVNDIKDIVDDIRLMLHGNTGTSGLRKFFNDATSRLDDIQTQGNGARVTTTELRNLLATLLRNELVQQGITR